MFLKIILMKSSICERIYLMLKVLKKATTPPGGWRYVCVETGFPFYADNLQQLVDKVTAHLKANKREVAPNLSDIIENAVCHMMPEGICSEEGKPRRFVGASRRSTPNIINATIRLKTGNVVNQSVASSRAAICAECSHNARTRGCPTCNGTNRNLRDMIGGRSTPVDYKLQVCDILGVFVNVLVWLKEPGVSTKGKVDAGSKCWLS
jgi:hypothetical protein